MISSSMLMLFASASVEAQAQAQTVDAGQLLQQNRALLTPGGEEYRDATAGSDSADAVPGTSADVPPTIHVKRFTLNETLHGPLASQVRALFASAEGRDLTFAQITEVRIKLNTLLRKHDGAIVFAVLPEQDARNGVLKFDIVRGHIEDVSIRNKSRVSDVMLEHIFRINRKRDAATPANTPQLPELLHAVDVARVMPGIASVTPVLSRGDEEGGTKARIDIDPERALQGSLVMDNGGSPGAGRYRIGTQWVANSPFGIGDRARLTAFGAPGGIQDKDGRDGHTWIGVASYEVPMGFSGARGGVQYSRVQYALGGMLQGLGNGFASVASAYVNQPLVLSVDDELQLGVTFSRKMLSDVFFDYDFRRRSTVASFALSGTHYGSAFGRANAFQYGMSLDAGKIKQLSAGLGDPSTAGEFVKWNGSADYTQSLWRGANLRARFSAQLANRHLDSSEQMSLGGPNAVRAYGYEAPSVDVGAIVSLDLSQQIPVIPGLSAKTFVDVGQGVINRTQALVGAGNTWTAAGYGVGLSYQYKNRARFEISQAIRIGTPEGQRPAHSQTWMTASLAF
jgi:hemolysin activation/secretion protein